MRFTAEALTLLLTALKVAGIVPLPWIVVLAPVLLKYTLFAGATAVMARGRKR